MKSIIIGFSRPIKWKPYAKAIMFLDGTNYDHGYIRIPSLNWGCDFIYQSSGIRTNFMGGEWFFKNNVSVEEYKFNLTEELESKLGKLIVDREGIPYAILQVIGKGLVKILYYLSLKKINIPNPIKGNENKTDCIEEIAYILSTACGIEIKLDMNTITPKSFRDFISSLPQGERIK